MFDLASRDSVAKIRKVGRKTKEILSFFCRKGGSSVIFKKKGGGWGVMELRKIEELWS